MNANEKPQPQFAIEPLENRVLFNIIDWCIAIIQNQDPKSVVTQPGGYDPKISLLPFGQK